MKKLLRALFIITGIIFHTALFAGTVVVKGKISDTLNHPIPYKSVTIYNADSSGCVISHTVTTNANGMYFDSLKCSNDITKVFVITEDCAGARIVKDAHVPASGVVEVNFVLCVTAPPPTCKALYAFTQVPNGLKFSAAGSSAPAGDSITSYTWNFGDSTPVAKGTKDPLHVYAKAGLYNVCLTIKTKNGCESNFCQQVTFLSTSCNATAAFTIEQTGPKKFRFNSTQSTTLAGDSIYQRIWQFGDGSSTDGNKILVDKEFAANGTFNVCLKITTVKGCNNTICATVTVKDSTQSTPANCKASFTYSIKDSIVTFNSSASVASSVAGDSIISRIWSYTDSANNISLEGNVVSPSYTYTKPGTYKVTLTIKTKKGCESKTSVLVTIPGPPAPPASCKATFTYSIKDSVVTFNSAASVASSVEGDSIISRIWSYSDSVNNVTLDGNVIAPSYPYTKPGAYKVTLTIKTKKGCESKTSVMVIIPTPPPPASCKALFTYTMQNGSVKFISQSAGATATDSITSLTWLFGDSTVPVQGSRDPLHVYAKSGKYTVVLYIKTKSGCESKYTATLTVTVQPPVACSVDVQFTATRVSLKKVQFNSSLSKTGLGDSIIQRSWKFGDGSSGNDINPAKEYAQPGIYNACLEVKTARGCTMQTCQQVLVKDTVTTPQAATDYLKIVSINPNPVTTRMMATIYSRNTNAEVEIAIYDIYGAKRSTLKKLLPQGNTTVEISTSFLYAGPYFLKVSSASGKDSKGFYKF